MINRKLVWGAVAGMLAVAAWCAALLVQMA